MKTCADCKNQLPLGHFSKRGSGYQSKCKACQALYYKRYYQADNKEKDRLRSKNSERRKSVAERVSKIKESKPCMDCSGYFPAVCMDFDHTEANKTASVSNMVRNIRPWAAIEREINKCELVCANCHRLRTQARAQFGIV